MAATKKLTKAQVLKLAKAYGEECNKFIVFANELALKTLNRASEIAAEIRAASNDFLYSSKGLGRADTTMEVRIGAVKFSKRPAGEKIVGAGHVGCYMDTWNERYFDASDAESFAALNAVTENALYDAIYNALKNHQDHVQL